ncbi:unnamed protein product [Darwinula stevensoni]|uniref:ADP-ribosylglycohydrolase n=1 Tax=Darwinula stevensoni TaxID=69355 RepID=A0A7R9FQD5_9CRUS|nr:unnamed protein product [Darwinula stevensoni]CAG0899586.1 unnamed protein product [Darwinula stevensoni]
MGLRARRPTIPEGIGMGIATSSASPEVSDPDDLGNVKLDLSQSLPHDAFAKTGEIPASLPHHIPHCTSLDLSHNHIYSLPDSICLLLHLVDLNLSHNDLSELPETMGYLRKLERLDMSYNSLTGIPPLLGTLPRLEKLNMGHNKIRMVPSTFSENNSLSIFILSENPTKFPPREVSNAGSASVLAYLRSQATPKKPTPMLMKRKTFLRQASDISRADALDSSPPSPLNRIRNPLLIPQGASSYTPKELSDKIAGLLYGAALGDALGIGTQFLSPDEIQFYYEAEVYDFQHIIRDSTRSYWKRGDWTDNFDITVLRDEAFPTDPHGVAVKVRPRFEEFTDPFCLPRAIICGIGNFHDLEEVENNAIRICKTTHSDKAAVAASVLLATLVASMLQGKSGTESLSLLSSSASPYLHEHVNGEAKESGRDPLSVLCSACTAALEEKEAKDFKETLFHVIERGGYASVSGAIAGSLLGLRLGYQGLPEDWLDGILPPNRLYLDTKINSLLDMMGLP